MQGRALLACKYSSDFDVYSGAERIGFARYFESVTNDADSVLVFDDKQLFYEDWENIKQTSDFLEPAASFIEMACSVDNVTISL